MKKEVYIAANKSGQIRVYTSYPERDEHFGIFTGEHIGCISTLFMLFESDGMKLPDIKYKDEPRKFVITIEEMP